jgi:hypothetical protein
MVAEQVLRVKVNDGKERAEIVGSLYAAVREQLENRSDRLRWTNMQKAIKTHMREATIDYSIYEQVTESFITQVFGIFASQKGMDSIRAERFLEASLDGQAKAVSRILNVLSEYVDSNIGRDGGTTTK